MAMVHTWNDSESVRFLTERMDSYRFLKVFIAILCVVLCCGEHRMQESGNLVSDMSQSSLRCLVYDLNTTDTARTLLELHQTMFPEVNVVVVMKQVHVQQLMKTVNSFDEMTKGQTDFQHHSKWLLVIEDLKLTDLRGYIALENVALILPLSKRILHTVLTVRHHPGQNVFVPVEPCVARDYISCLYPNTAYGYNNRHLRVTTLESNRFISKYVLNATTRHEGYAIEILDIITQALNLSYSITEPEDGAWGLPVNGTYSGIVGQLYRRASSNTSIQGRLWAKITNNDPSFLKSDVSNHMQRMKQQKYALVMFKSTVDLHLAEDCQFEPLGAQELWIHLAFGIPKNSPLKDDIERIMSYLSQSGILEKLWRKWHVTRSEHQCVSRRSMAGMTLEQISGGFILGGVGLVISIISLCLENLVQ